MLLLHCFYLFFILITPINSASLNRSHNETSNYEEFRDITVQVPDINVIKTISSYFSSYFESELSERRPLITHNEISSYEEGEFRDICIGGLCIQTPDTIFRAISNIPNRISNYLSPTVCETNSCEQCKMIV
jgi:hypothetical protein